MLEEYSEKIYIVNEYAFSVADTGNCFTVGVCSEDAYRNTEQPEFVLVGIYKQSDGYTLEKIKDNLENDSYVMSAVKLYYQQLEEQRRSKRRNDDFRESRILEEIKGVAQATSETCWTLEEASQYSKIGINRIRKLSRQKNCAWVFCIADAKRVVKIDAFKKWLEETTYIA